MLPLALSLGSLSVPWICALTVLGATVLASVTWFASVIWFTWNLRVVLLLAIDRFIAHLNRHPGDWPWRRQDDAHAGLQGDEVTGVSCNGRKDSAWIDQDGNLARD